MFLFWKHSAGPTFNFMSLDIIRIAIITIFVFSRSSCTKIHYRMETKIQHLSLLPASLHAHRPPWPGDGSTLLLIEDLQTQLSSRVFSENSFGFQCQRHSSEVFSLNGHSSSAMPAMCAHVVGRMLPIVYCTEKKNIIFFHTGFVFFFFFTCLLP